MVAERSHVGLRLGLGLGLGLGLEIWLGLGLVLGLALGLPRDFFQPFTIKSAEPQFLIGRNGCSNWKTLCFDMEM